MRVLFSVNNFGFLRNFEPALRELAARGHDIHLLAERQDAVGGSRTIDNLQRAHPDRFTWSFAPSRKQEPWHPLATQLRLCLDAWRYLDPRWAEAKSLRARGFRQAPAFASRVAQSPFVGSPAAMAVWTRLARGAEQAMPAGDVAVSVLRELEPDLLLLTPLLYFGSSQVEYVRAARRLGIRTVLGVGSWDHLTTKGLIHERPDTVIVWNEAQRQEAAELHGVPPDRVVVTGAQAYDHWFTQQPSTSREAFCTRVGLPADRPILLYLCSSPFITPHEVGFVRRWVAAIRNAPDAGLRRASILVRPHPQNAAQWKDVDPSFDDAFSIWPRAGANPVDTDARAEYFDSMFHSAAVVGVNTSALIESGIVGRPVFTVASDEFSGQQDGTLHFQHLKNVNGGLLTMAATLDEHVAQLTPAVRPGGAPFAGRAFVESFIRPRGWDSPAAGHFADAIEAQLAAPAPAPAREPASAPLRRALLAPVALLARRMKPRRKAAADDKDAGVPSARLRILFILLSPEYLRYYDTTMKLLADRGHHVIVAVNSLRERKHARLDLVDDPRITVLGTVVKRLDMWTPFARALRGTLDFCRYLDPRFAGAPELRTRMYRKALPPALRPLNRIRSLSVEGCGRVIRALQACERAIPVSPRIARYLEVQSPDAVIVTPLVDAASDQVDFVRAAQALGVPAAAAISSWDNLTNKGHLRVSPDLVTVWNGHQRDEAVEFHGLNAAQVAVTGAQPFDRWFDREPSQSREAFCAMVGLPADRPFVLFTGSSVFIARSEIEVPFVRQWIAALRASADPALRDIPVLVRPHPFNADGWTSADLTDLGPAAIWPRGRFTPADEAARTSFFDSLFYSAAVVGINTSAMVEAAILQKPVLSLLTPEFAGTQEGTLHFHYLLPENGGFLRIANSLDAHVEQLREVLRDPEATRAQTAGFVERFLRPHGLDRPATPILADAFEQLARAGRAPARETLGTRALRIVLRPLAFCVHGFKLDRDWKAGVQRAAYRLWARLGKTTRLAIKRLVLRPFHLGVWWAAKGVRSLRRLAVLSYRALRRVASVVIFGPVRAARLARYRIAVRLKGGVPRSELGNQEGDGRS